MITVRNRHITRYPELNHTPLRLRCLTNGTDPRWLYTSHVQFIHPMPLRRLPEPFDHPDWLYELKYDGFRSLAVIEKGACRLISRNANTFTSFRPLADALGAAQIAHSAVIDGELACVDDSGHPRFNDLLYRRAAPAFFAFDVVALNGKDLRNVPLIQRKQLLQGLVRGQCERLVYVDHVVGKGAWLFEQARKLDLEGIVCKHRDGRYVSDRETSSWIKVKNPDYSQIVGRDEHFERLERPHEPAQAGWDSCAAACEAI